MKARYTSVVAIALAIGWAMVDASPSLARDGAQGQATRADGAYAFDLSLRGNETPATARLASFTDPFIADDETSEEITTIDEMDDLNWDLAGPYEMRSADPEPTGVVELKNIFGWSTSKSGESDEWMYEFEVEWGIAENHELIFETPVELGDGRVDGNGDIEIGWHWQLVKEQDWMPAFALRNFVRVPTGVGSSGVDYELIGLITKSIVPGKLRFEANPFVKTVNGDNDEDAGDFVWGGSFGLDWRVSDELVLVGLYRYVSGAIEGERDNHNLQFGGEWEFAKNQELGFSAEVGIDGDGNGPAFGAMLSYILSFGE